MIRIRPLTLRRSRLDRITDLQARAERVHYRVRALAKDCGVSEQQLRRFIWLRFGKSPHDWLIEKRLALAQTSFDQGALVKEAAARAGFDDPAHFTRLFTRQHGFPPSGFRPTQQA